MKDFVFSKRLVNGLTFARDCDTGFDGAPASASAANSQRLDAPLFA